MRTARSFAVLITALLFSPLSAHAEAMRCGRQFVPDGSSLAQVRQICGAPTRAERHVEHYTHELQAGGGHVITYTTDLVIDELSYDFGPTTWMLKVVFHDGRMVTWIKGSWGKPR